MALQPIPELTMIDTTLGLHPFASNDFAEGRILDEMTLLHILGCLLLLLLFKLNHYTQLAHLSSSFRALFRCYYYLPSNTTIHLIAQELATSDYAKVDLRRTLAATFLHYGVTKNLAHRASSATVVMTHRNCTTALLNGEQPFVWKHCYCYYHCHLNMIRDKARMRGRRSFFVGTDYYLSMQTTNLECFCIAIEWWGSVEHSGCLMRFRQSKTSLSLWIARILTLAKQSLVCGYHVECIMHLLAWIGEENMGRTWGEHSLLFMLQPSHLVEKGTLRHTEAN